MRWYGGTVGSKGGTVGGKGKGGTVGGNGSIVGGKGSTVGGKGKGGTVGGKGKGGNSLRAVESQHLTVASPSEHGVTGVTWVLENGNLLSC